MQVGFPAAAAAQVDHAIEAVTGQMDALRLKPIKSDFQLRLGSRSAYPDADATKNWTASWIADPRPAFNAISSALASSLNVSAVIALAVEYLQGTEEDNVFGERKWEAIGCRIAAPPSLPLEFEGVWQGDCPGVSGKKVHEVCYLYFMPKEANGKPLNPYNMGEVAKLAPGSRRAQYTTEAIKNELVTEDGGLSSLCVERPYWALIPTVVTEELRRKTTEEQEGLIPQGWEKPGVLDAVVANFTWYLWTGRYMHGRDPLTQVCCKERPLQMGISADDYTLFVGSFDQEGLHVYMRHILDSSYTCTIGMRKFFGPIVPKAKL